jgi:hypothetical protein
MPPKSQAQRRFGFAAAAGKVPGVPKKVGVEFEGPGLKGFPAKVRQPKMPEPGVEPLQVEHTSKHH